MESGARSGHVERMRLSRAWLAGATVLLLFLAAFFRQ